MPVYTFVCKDCGTRKTEIARMSEVNDLSPVCIGCSKQMGRDYRTDLFSTPNDSYSRPIHSDALAVSPDQRKEHESKFPYIRLDDKCRPIFDNYTSHQRYLDETGFVKEPGKSKRKATKVS